MKDGCVDVTRPIQWEARRRKNREESKTEQEASQAGNRAGNRQKSPVSDSFPKIEGARCPAPDERRCPLAVRSLIRLEIAAAAHAGSMAGRRLDRRRTGVLPEALICVGLRRTSARVADHGSGRCLGRARRPVPMSPPYRRIRRRAPVGSALRRKSPRRRRLVATPLRGSPAPH